VRPSLTFWILLGIAGIVAFHAISTPKQHSHNSPNQSDVTGTIKTALDSFEVDHGFYPESFQDLLQRPSSSTNWHGPYLEKFPIDPWGHKFIYEYPGKHNTNGYDLFSAGPDGKPGTGDDIVNW
jgi:general secretion pathway protein G